MNCLHTLALQALMTSAPLAKAQATQALGLKGNEINAQLNLDEPAGLPGRPAKPLLVPPRLVPKRSLNTPEGHAAIVHAITHIEFNAIDLALDVVWRFSDMPEAFYRDWLQVACEEATHFLLLNAHLNTLGYQYGDFPAHNSLWEMADKTKHDIVARLALVPRTLEARGLDASPPLRHKLHSLGDEAGAKILDIILRDEIGHVAIGNRWYRQVCSDRGLDPVAIYPELALQYKAPKLRGPFNLEARRKAGFDADELAALDAQSL
jgi:uncharacterized ferritin-like protein (DUF455 family)